MLARTIADLAGSERIQLARIAAFCNRATRYRLRRIE